MKKRILISGGGIAGLTATKLLQSQGHELILVDKAKEFTTEGFLLSLKSFGVKIMEELGLAQDLLAASIPSQWMNFVDGKGSLIRKISYQKLNENLNPSVLITRGMIHHVLYQAIKDKVSVEFNTSIARVQQDGQKVSVTLSDNRVIQADLLIVAEGLRSTTREKYFKNSHLEDFNIFYMGGRLKDNHPYTVGTFKTYIDVNKMLSIYPLTNEELAIQCYINNTDEGAQIQDQAQSILKETFKEYNSEVKHLMDRFLESGKVFADKMGIVHVPNLVNERIVLVGDAGYCPTALSGMGASLSIYGASALAHYIAQVPDNIPLALQNYNGLMQPIIEKFQSNARNNAESFLPKSETTLEMFKSAFSTAPESVLHQKLTDQLVLTDDQLHYIL